MTIAVVQSAVFETGSTAMGTLTSPFASNNGAAGGLAAFVSFAAAHHSVVTDTKGNTWTKRSTTSGQSGNTCELWTCPSCAAGANSVSAVLKDASNVDTVSAWSAIHVVELSGQDTTDWLDVLAAFHGGTGPGTGATTALSAPITTVADNAEILLFCQYWNGGHGQTIASPLTLLQQDSPNQETFSASGAQATHGAHTYTATLASADTFDGFVLSVKPAGGGPTFTPDEDTGLWLPQDYRQRTPEGLVTVYA